MLRAWLRIAGIVATLILCVPLHYGWRLFGHVSPWPRFFLGSVGRIAGMRSRILGTPLASDVLFVCNHLSWLDIMLVADATGAAFVSKDDVARWPIIGWLAGLNGTLFVARSERRAVHGQADSLRAALGTGRPIALFPEGTTKGGLELLPFRASLFAAVLPPPAGVRIQPIAIDYGEAAADIAWTGQEPASANAMRVLSRRGTAEVTLHFLDPVDPAAWLDRKTLAADVRQRIMEALQASAGPRDRL